MLAELAVAAVAAVGCGGQGSGSFSDPQAGRPLILGDGFRDMSHLTRREVERDGHYKSGVLLRPGHVATIRVRGARLAYGGREGRALRFACAQPAAVVGGVRYAFWPGYVLLSHWPACVRVTIRVDDRNPRRRRVPVGSDGCA